MNERIKELELEAAYGIIDPNEPFTAEEFHNFTKKFAELIVKECAKVCESRVGNSDYNTGRMHCASDLREHFGVE